MFHVKRTYLILKPRFVQPYKTAHYPDLSENSLEIEENKAPSKSIDNTGVSKGKALKNEIFRSFSMKWKLFASLLLLNSICFGQLEPVAIGEWKIHMPLNNAKDVTRADQKVYTAFSNGVLIYNIEDGSHDLLSKANGLTTIGISQIEYDATSNHVIIGYNDGNLDLVSSEGEIYNMGDIQRSNIIGDKSIYNLVCFNGYVYICTGFGIVVLDPTRKEIKDTYIFGTGGTNIKVNSACSDGSKIYAATDDGLFWANLSNPFLSNPTSWTKDLSLNTAAVNGPFDHIAYHNSNLIVSREITGNNNDSAYVFNGSWSYFTQAFSNDVVKLKTIGNRLVFMGNGTISHYDASMGVVSDMSTYTFDYIDAADSDFDPNTSYIYLADKRHGLTRGLNSWGNEKLSPAAPFTTGSFRVSALGGNVCITHDGFAGVNGINNFAKGYFSGTYDGKWINYNNQTQPTAIIADSTYDAVSVIIDPKDADHSYVGTYSCKGLFEMKDGNIIGVWDESNSEITSAGISGYNSISALDYDDKGNLWMINSKSLEPLVVKEADGTWSRFDLGPAMKNRNIYDVEASKSGYVWVAAPTGNSTGGLMVYNYNETMDDQTDDEYFLYTIGSGLGNLPSQDVKCVTEDLDEEIWIGTANGIAVVYAQESVFSGGNADAQQILIEQDGNVQILLENEVVTDIEVDGANRKWIATDGSGAFLMSEDGQTEILRLTKENSPLLANIVNDISVDAVTGDVYFATSEGVVSLRYTATGSGNAYLDVYAFPNPVSETYNGIVAVKGISRDSDFKVTDVSGNLVYHGNSLGGQAIWDLKDISGNRVSSGVYLIYCNSENGSKDAVVKLLVIN